MFAIWYRYVPLLFTLLLVLLLPLPSFAADAPVPSAEIKVLMSKWQEAFNAQKYDDAMKLGVEVLTKARTLKDAAGEVEGLTEIGLVHAYTAHWKEAQTEQEQALELARTCGYKPGEGDALDNLGSIFASTGKPEKAVDFYTQELSVRKAAGDKANEANCLINLGAVYRPEQLQKAIDLFRHALEIRKSLGDRTGEGVCLNAIGLAYQNTHRDKQALEFYKQALTLSRDLGDKSGEATTLRNIGFLENSANKFREALKTFQQELSIRRTLGDKQQEARCLFAIGMIFHALGQENMALEYLEPALLLARTVGDKLQEVNTLLMMGYAYEFSGRPLKALDLCEQALRLSGDAGAKANEARSASQIGALYWEMGDFQKAMEYNEQALRLSRDQHFQAQEAIVLADIGYVYSALGQPQKALEFCKQALTLSHRLVYRVGGYEQYILMATGDTYHTMHQPAQAIEFYRRGLAVYAGSQDLVIDNSIRNELAREYRTLGDPQKALGILTEVLARSRAHRNRWQEAYALHQTGLCYRDLGQLHKALDDLQKAATIYRETVDPVDAAEALKDMAIIEEQKKQHTDAERDLNGSLQIMEHVRSSLGGHSEDKVSYLESHLDSYHEYLHLLLRRHDLAGAFALAQKTKGRSLLDLMSSGRVDLTASLSEGEQKQEQALRRKADALSEQMMAEGVNNEPGARKRFADLKSQLVRAESDLQVWTDAAYARHPDLARKSVAKTITLADAAKFLPSDTALMEYVVIHREVSHGKMRDEIAVFVVTTAAGRPRITEFTVPIQRNALIADIDSLRAACADPRKSYANSARSVYRLLIAPAARPLAGKKHLVLCPDGPLWDVPFATLENLQGTPLLARYDLSYGYSATGVQAALLAHNARTRVKPERTLLVVANPAFGDNTRFGDSPDIPGQRPIEAPSRPLEAPSRPIEAPSRPLDEPSRTPGALFADMFLLRGGGLHALPGTQREADALRQDFPDAMVYTGAQAQEATVKKEAGKYRYLHFATHGFFNDAAPMLSSIVLAQPKDSSEDGFLTAREIFGLDLNAEMVVLSACNTARGAKRSGEGLVGLTWALFVAGAPSQVLTQWSVDDASTATFMEEFYNGIVQGKSKQTALRQAALALSKDGKHAHPYYWAPFVLLGDWR